MVKPGEFLFGTVGAPISTPKKPGGSAGAIQQIHLLSLSTMELGWVQSVRVTESTCQAIRESGNNHQVALSVHAPYFINLNATEDEWPKSRKRLMDAAHYGNLAGATDIIFHPGSYFGAPAEDVLRVAIPRLQGCVDELRSTGNPVNLRPETMGKPALLGSLGDVILMAKQILGVIPCLDFAHLHARTGDGSFNSYNEFSRALEFYANSLGINSLLNLHIHLSGVEYSKAGERNHLPLKESDFDLVGLLNAMHKLGCAGRILCESPIMEEDAQYLMTTWKNPQD
jgi:deoxyribonuclease-4